LTLKFWYDDEKKPMKRKIEIGLLIALVSIALTVFLLTYYPQHQLKDGTSTNEKKISIRNVTKKAIHYSIWPWDSQNRLEKEKLKVGEIRRYASQATTDIVFESGGNLITRHLIPGKPYCFRYDENNKIQIYEGSHGMAEAPDLAPYLSTPTEIIEKMLELAEVDSQDVLYDLGCGDGRILITAAKKYGTRGVGIDIVPQRIEESRLAALEAGVEDFVEFHLGDAAKMNISEATVVALYLLPESNEILRPRFEKQLKPGVFVVCHNYTIPGWEDKEVNAVAIKDKKDKDHTIFLYKR
jgi:hypothetical protein